jgi:hypothetical protein
MDQKGSKLIMEAVPWLGRLVTIFPPRRPGFEPGSVHVGFVVDKVALWQVFPPSSSVFFCQYHHSTRVPYPHIIWRKNNRSVGDRSWETWSHPMGKENTITTNGEMKSQKQPSSRTEGCCVFSPLAHRVCENIHGSSDPWLSMQCRHKLLCEANISGRKHALSDRNYHRTFRRLSQLRAVSARTLSVTDTACFISASHSLVLSHYRRQLLTAVSGDRLSVRRGLDRFLPNFNLVTVQQRLTVVQWGYVRTNRWGNRHRDEMTLELKNLQVIMKIFIIYTLN